MKNLIEKQFNLKFIIFFIVLLSYFPAYLFNYAFSDDYALLGQVIAGFCDTFKWDIMSGRPLFAGLRLMAYEFHVGLTDLAYLRAFSAVCAAGFSVHLFIFLKKRGIMDTDIKRTLLAVSLSVLPTFQVYTSWATCSVYIMATWIALFSYDCLATKRLSHPARYLVSFLLISASFAIYQPAGMAVLAFAFLDVCLSEKEICIKKCFSSFALTASGVLSSAVMTKIIPQLVYGETFQRAAFTHDFFSKVKWFFTQPMRMAVSNYDITLSLWYLVFSSAITLIGLFHVSRLKDGWWKLVLVAMFAIGSFSLSLIVSESWATWRTMPGLTIIITSLFITGLMYINQKFYGSNPTFTFGLLALIIMSCSYNIFRGFVIPQRSELQSFAAEISNKVEKNYAGKVMIDITNPTYNAFSSVQHTDEFGSISLANEWAPWGMALYLKKTKGFSFYIPYKPTIKSEDDCKVDCIKVNTGVAMLKSTTVF